VAADAAGTSALVYYNAIAVTMTNPAANSHTAGDMMAATATYPAGVDPAPAPNEMVVHGSFSGYHTGLWDRASADTIRFRTDLPYAAGELVSVSLTNNVTSSGFPADGYVFQYRTVA